MELTPEQLERLFRNLERVSTIGDSLEKACHRLDRQEARIKLQEEQHEENLARLTNLSDKMNQSQQEDRQAGQLIISSVNEIRRVIESTKIELSDRVEKLEAPFKIVIARRQARRQLWLHITGWSSVAGAFAWVFLEPARKFVIEWLLSGWLPPHK